MREFGIGLGFVVSGLCLWGAGYFMGKVSVLKRVQQYFNIYHAGHPVEGQDLIRFLEK